MQKYNLVSRIFLSISIVLFLTACEKDVSPTTDHEKAIYAMGVKTGTELENFKLSEKELKIYYAGVKDQVLKKKLQVNAEEFMNKSQDVRQAKIETELKNRSEESQKYLEKMAASSGATKKPSGMIVLSSTPGKGKGPKGNDRVKINYVGTLPDGSVFDSTLKRNEPVQFNLPNGIACWAEALKEMKEGGKAQIVCPAKLAYGDQGIPPMIPGGAALTFDLELISVVAEAPAPSATPQKTSTALPVAAKKKTAAKVPEKKKTKKK